MTFALDRNTEQKPVIRWLQPCHYLGRCSSEDDRREPRCPSLCRRSRDVFLPNAPSWPQQNQTANGRSLSGWFAEVVTIYGALFCIVIALNASAMLYTAYSLAPHKQLWYQAAGIPTAANLLVALLSRNEHFVNAIFQVACIRPQGAPLWLRVACSHVHHYGGLHSGCAVAAATWHCLQTALITVCVSAGQTDPSTAAISWVILLLLAGIVLLALPSLRQAKHNSFEIMHRFAGWLIVILYWVQLFNLASAASAANGQSMWESLRASAAVWCLIATTSLAVYPWLRVKKRVLNAKRLSDHAVELCFNGRAGPCTAVKLSHNPLRENHPFACIPERERQEVFSVIVSNAGDWTSQLIEAPPRSIWIRETPQRGVLWVARMFSPVVIVATGSGIGPCLSLFNGCPDLHCRVLWSARQPEATYGKAIMCRVLQADHNAIIIDTDTVGRPNLQREALRLYEEARAEAVVVISNRALTCSIVRYLSQRGVCARGPIWDS